MFEFLKPLIGIADDVGAIQAIKSKLFKNPDPAADKLIVALGEIKKTYDSIETELNEYLSLRFDPSNPDALRNELKILLALEGGKVMARMGEARGHCGKIDNIYDKYLNPWFEKILSNTEYEMMRKLFYSLRDSDTIMLDSIDKLAEWLTKEAKATHRLIDYGRFEEANQRIKTARINALPKRLKIAKAMRKLYKLQAEFIKASGTV